ncbi:coiled-coil domain-containing protein [Mangrovimonas spongiae]|uniref:Chromosome partitioning protein ParA n=1 Tax=Mangrovimonas spongiae TaxID=2494697 RepID=A0A3R9URH1_9FLAO|nr:chromosome partitioning protein ParA [Mangrovimonas spongiae]RSK38594.1 chromosome partitioning protein ParA [Mangrovimonas spongiae]
MENNKSNLGLKVGLGIALVLFLGATFISFNLFNEKKETEAQLTEEKELVMKDLNNMSKQYDLAIQDNEIKNEKLAEAKERIDGLIDSLKVSETNVRSLWRYKQKYLSLQKEMDVLLEENDRLKIENELLATSLDSTKLQLEERSMFTDSLLVQNTELAEVVENASVLQTVDLKGFGVIERTSGKLIPTERARRSDKLRVCFTVAKNTLVQPGDQELYIQVIDPNNNTLGVNEQVQFDEKTLNYSLVSKFNYENANLNICEFVEPSNDDGFEKGRYMVNVFNKKDLVSTTEFTLR